MKTESPSLSENDYLTVLRIIGALQKCETKKDLELLIPNEIIKPFNVQHVSFVWIDIDLNTKTCNSHRFFVSYGGSPEEEAIVPKIMSYVRSYPEKIASTLRTTIAYDVDIPQAKLEEEVNLYIKDHPEHKETLGNSGRSRRWIGMHDPNDNGLGVGFARHYPNETPFTFRELRMAELIRPTVLQTMKYVAINEELKNYKSLSKVLAESETAMAMVNPHGFVIFANDGFQQILNVKQADFLPRDLITLLQEKSDLYSPSKNGHEIEIPLEDCTFYDVEDISYRLSWTRLKRPGEPEDQCWLLRLKPAVDPYSQSLLTMRNAKLTRRETEIAILICDGIADSEISSRLFISEYTVKNHVSNIFKKFNINKRIQLMALLKNTKAQNGN